MIVQCPNCSTRYEIDAARLAGPNPMLKCSRCRHVFPAPSAQGAAPRRAPVEPKPAPPAQESLTLPFDDGGWKDEADDLAPHDLTVPELDEHFTLGAGTATEESSVPLFVPEPEPVAPPLPAKRAAPRRSDDADDDGPKAQRHRGEHRRGRERGKVRVVFVFLALVIGGYAVLARAFLVSPALTDRMLGKVPFIGAAGNDRLTIRKVALSDVVGNYQRIKDGKEVFVIGGKALNTAPVALRGVQIGAQLYDSGGRELGRKTIYCGNVISAKVLKDLTPRELSVLQNVDPPKSFMIEPGESSTFVIVFMDPPTGATEFSTKIVAAQRHT